MHLLQIFIICGLLSQTEEAGVQKWRTIKTSTSDQIQEEHVQRLIKRIIPSNHGDSFVIAIDSRLAKDDKDWISVVSDGVKVTIKANTGVAAALGLHIYLKDYCNCHISWEVVRIDLPEKFLLLTSKSTPWTNFGTCLMFVPLGILTLFGTGPSGRLTLTGWP